MFTGIIEEIGIVESLAMVDGGWSLTVQARTVLQGATLGHSVAVNGACLTVTALSDHSFTVGLSPETLRRTNLGDLRPGDGVNLERSLAADGRIGGHFLQGHVDGTGIIRAFRPEGDSLWVTVAAGPELLRYIVPKGYIAVDGTSLTVVDVLPDGFTFMLVAYTQQHITLPRKPIGSRVNLEVDVLAKYVEKLIREAPYAIR
ncbi:riboflavin synthase [Chloroflexus sp.]|uniref:riboflavin synthase n=1 Tax=Chloroflexus sp. TaxID=1904827 RepID=UPI002ACEFAFA|nr:riboflavin synthase [Chloroflexus sp.]